MRQPLWILNSGLLVLFIVGQLLLFFLQKAIPVRIKMNPSSVEAVQQDQVASIDISTIYKNDLFNTYVSPTPTVDKLDDTVAPIPTMPQAINVSIPVEKAPTFFAPLEVTLKGVIFVADDPSSSLAIIQDKKSKEEQNYQVGDLIEDAQILKVLSNRVIVIRSNGQQETLYLREEDAKQEFETEVSYFPKNVVEKQTTNQYRINLDEFSKRVQSLGEFINLLDLTTVYHHGKSVGCRVGKISKDSLGSMLGFDYDDIIVSVEHIDATDLHNRIAIYDAVMAKKPGDVISVSIKRGGSNLDIQYALIDNTLKKAGLTAKEMLQASQGDSSKGDETSSSNQTSNAKAETTSNVKQKTSSTTTQSSANDAQESPSSIPMLDQQTLHELEAHKKRLLSQREKMAPTLKELEFQERLRMLRGGKKNAILNGTKK